MEITSFIIFIRGDLLLDIHSEIEFYGSAEASPKNLILDGPYIQRSTSPNENFSTVIP